MQQAQLIFMYIGIASSVFFALIGMTVVFASVARTLKTQVKEAFTK